MKIKNDLKEKWEFIKQLGWPDYLLLIAVTIPFVLAIILELRK